eukprot:05523.XXX_75842_76075_1 [CDS] Oithona nana genome sequencing.
MLLMFVSYDSIEFFSGFLFLVTKSVIIPFFGKVGKTDSSYSNGSYPCVQKSSQRPFWSRTVYFVVFCVIFGRFFWIN